MIRSSRTDLSEWIMHFIHKRDISNILSYESNNDCDYDLNLFPFHEDKEKNERFDKWKMYDEYLELTSDDYAFSILIKILKDGYIRSGWSFRGKKPTIYGPRSACCFTEMPLYALIEYAKQRPSNSVDTYAICLLREELYKAGGRPVIYGLSGPHREVDKPDPDPSYFRTWPRKLHPSCGLGENEHYRYVSMNLGSRKHIDWGHEREWRWADINDACSCPGLPVWLENEPYQFSCVMIIVPTQKEADIILDKTKELYDVGYNEYSYLYNKKTLRKTYVVALEAVKNLVSPDKFKLIRLENLPRLSMNLFSDPSIDENYEINVKNILKKAHMVAENSSKKFIELARKDAEGFVIDSCGFADLFLHSPQHPLVTALMNLGEAKAFGSAGYLVSNFGSKNHGSQSISVAEAAVEAARNVMQEHFPDAVFSMHSRLD